MSFLGLAVGSTSRPALASQRPIAIPHQTVTFGALTRAGAGAVAFHHSGTMASLAKTGGGTAAAEWQVIGNRLAPAQDGGLTDGGTVELVANPGHADEAVFTVLVQVIPGRFDVDSFAEPWPGIDSPELVAAWEAAADGHAIVARDTGETMSAAPDVEIVCDRTSVVRGEAVQVELRFNNGPRHRLFLTAFVKWTFGTDDYTFDALPADSEVRPGRSALHAYGPLGCHVFESGPAHAISAEVRMLGGRTAVPAAQVIDVLDPDTVFAGGRTIVWTTDGDAAGAPAGAIHYTSAASGGDVSGATLYDAIAAANAVTPRGRLLLKGGQTTELGEPTTGTDAIFGLHVASFGTGRHRLASARTTVSSGGLLKLRTTDDTEHGTPPAIRNIEVLGRYDAANPQAFGIDETHSVFDDSTHIRGATLCGLRISGMGSTTSFDPQSRHSVVNCEITNWFDIGIFSNVDQLLQTESTGRKRVRGCWIHQKTDVVRRLSDAELSALGVSYNRVANTDDGVHLNWALHGPIRFNHATGDAIQQCRLESYSGWSSLNSTATADQPAIRLNSGGGGERIRVGIRSVVAGNHLLGSVGEGGSSASAWGSFQWTMPLHHIAFNTWTGKPRGTVMLNVRVGTYSLWNNVYDAGGTLDPELEASGQDTVSVAPFDDLPPAFPDAALHCYGNTIKDDRPRTAQFSLIREEAPRSALTLANNLLFSTTATPPFSSFGEPVAPDYAVPAGSAAFQAAAGPLIAPVDRSGSPQGPGTASIGAVQAQAEGGVPPFAVTAVDVSGAFVDSAGSFPAGQTRATLAFRTRIGAAATTERLMSGAVRIQRTSQGELRVAITDTAGEFTAITTSTSPDVFAIGAEVSMLLSADLGGNIVCWANGAELFSVAPGRGNAFAETGLRLFGATSGLERWDGDLIGGLWVHVGEALDPAVWWDAFFDEGGLPRDLGASGTVGGLVPLFYVPNNASLAMWQNGSNFGSGGDWAVTGTFAEATV